MEYSMDALLDMFWQCNRFSLTSTLPIKEIPAKVKTVLLGENLNIVKNQLKERYDYYISKAPIPLPDFDTLFSEILDECKEFYNKVKSIAPEKIKQEIGSPFICDHAGKDTKYSEPMMLFWHFYHNVQNALMSNDDLQKMQECESLNTEHLFREINDETLKENLESYEFSFNTHCTSGPLQLVLYFPLNDATKQWLLKLKDDYDLENTGFEDLAFYNNDKLEFSSCTHEHFNSLD